MAIILLILIPFGLIGSSVYQVRKTGSFTSRTKVQLVAGIVLASIVAGFIIWIKYFVKISD